MTKWCSKVYDVLAELGNQVSGFQAAAANLTAMPQDKVGLGLYKAGVDEQLENLWSVDSTTYFRQAASGRTCMSSIMLRPSVISSHSSLQVRLASER